MGILQTLANDPTYEVEGVEREITKLENCGIDYNTITHLDFVNSAKQITESMYKEAIEETLKNSGDGDHELNILRTIKNNTDESLEKLEEYVNQGNT